MTAQILQFAPRAKRASDAESVSPPTTARKQIETAEATQQRRSLVALLGVSIKWCLITLGLLALLGLMMGPPA